MDSTLQKPAVTAKTPLKAAKIQLNWSKWMRQVHRWLSIAFTVAVVMNFVAVAQKKETVFVGLLALVPLALLLFTGWYMFALPYATKWRSGRRAD